jgi:hypothetical protein
MYVYQQTEPTLFTVGYYTPKGEWKPESDHDTRAEAADRVATLNGSNQHAEIIKQAIDQLERRLRAQRINTDALENLIAELQKACI